VHIVLPAGVFVCAALAGLGCGNGDGEQVASSPEPADGASDARTSDRSASEEGTGEDAPLSTPSACAEGGSESWTTFAAFTQDTLMGLSGTGSHDVWAAGLSSLWHWDGSTWTAAQPPPSAAPFDSARVWTGAPNDLWFATGLHEVWHWTGQVWTAYPPQDNRAIVYLWGNSVSDVWGSGQSADYSGHWDGTTWKEIEAFPNGPMWGSGATDLWAAAIDYAATDSGSQPFFPMCHWTGGPRWDEDAGVAPSAKHAIWGSRRSDVWAVGDGNAVHFDGNTWSNDVTLPTRQSLFGVWGSSASDVWAVGAGAVILHFDGATWSTSPSPAGGATLHAVWGSDRCDAWAVGAGGLVLRFAPYSGSP
jgi:hypothetical protein